MLSQVVYVDTEGFESTGRSNTYDDRIFAVATVLSSLLIYNLPETIRGSDVSKLSFAVDLAAGFYDQMKVRDPCQVETWTSRYSSLYVYLPCLASCSFNMTFCDMPQQKCHEPHTARC